MPVQLVCPTCRGPLDIRPEAQRCATCNVEYKYHQGVLCFLDPGETLNETPFEDLQTQKWTDSALLRDRIRESWLLSLINRVRIQISMSGRRDRIFYQGFANRRRDGGSLILDVGCGGGRHYLCDFGKVVGIDPVVSLLKVSKEIYSSVCQADAAALPFPDNTFDYVVSSDVVGHVTGVTKDKMFSEMHRVLKPGGRTIHIIETDSTGYWFRLAREIPAAFQERLIDRPGHIGLELPSAVHERFLKLGFKPVRVKPFTGDILACGEISSLFGNAYESRRWWLRGAVAFDRLMTKSLPTSEAVNVCCELLAQVADSVTPIDHACCLRVVYEKQ